MKIVFIGTGYVGLVAGTCLADLGNDVICVDNDREKIEKLKQDICPIYEPGLKELIVKNTKAGRLNFTDNLSDAIRNSSVIFIAVGTPQDTDGKADLKYVTEVSEEIGKAMNGEKVIVNKSTVPVGTADSVKEIISKHYRGIFHVVSNPEFLREGAAVRDFMEPDRIVIGSDNPTAKAIMEEIYKPLKATMVFTDVKSAELIKYASNTFLAVKISYINEIAILADKLGANVDDVATGLGLDKRINQHFLHAGCGWGGSCLPKDVNALIYTAEKYDLNLSIPKAARETNNRVKAFPVQKLRKRLGDIKGKRIALLGLSFKPNTDDVREASSIVIAQELKKSGAEIYAYDPAAEENARKVLPEINYCITPYEALNGAHAAILITEWPEFNSLDFSKVKRNMKNPLIVDGRNFLNKKTLTDLGFVYEGIGV
jgi:UDPglucose 6-dehydrogenase